MHPCEEKILRKKSNELQIFLYTCNMYKCKRQTFYMNFTWKQPWWILVRLLSQVKYVDVNFTEKYSFGNLHVKFKHDQFLPPYNIYIHTKLFDKNNRYFCNLPKIGLTYSMYGGGGWQFQISPHPIYVYILMEQPFLIDF